MLGCWPGNRRAMEAPNERGGTAGLSRGDRSAAADARAGEVPEAGSDSSGLWSVVECDCSARSSKSVSFPPAAQGVVSRSFRGVRTAKPGRDPRVFWKFSQRVPPPSKVQSDSAPENGTGGALMGWHGIVGADERLALTGSPAATTTRFPSLSRRQAVKPLFYKSPREKLM